MQEPIKHHTTINGVVQNEDLSYYVYTDLTLNEWRNKLANSTMFKYTFINDTTAIKVLNGVAYVQQYDNVNKSINITEARG